MRLKALPLRFDRRTAVGLALALAAGIMVFALTRPPATVPVLVAEGPLPAGIPLEGLPVGVRRVPDAAGLVAATDPAALDGWTLIAPLASGEPLVPSLLRAPERRSHPDVLALSLERDRAVLGDLQAGDRIDVWVTTADEEGPPVARLVAAAVYVVSAGPGPAGMGGSDRVDLLLAVDDSLAAALVSARQEGDLDLVRVSR
jgi:Flp pilus assembly protein CpaB